MSPERGNSGEKLKQELELIHLNRESSHPTHSHNIQKEGLGEDEFFIVLPFSDLSTWIYDKEETFKAFKALPIWRLNRIKQLSFLAFIGPSPEIQYLQEFNHTRLEHTLLVAKVTEAVLKRNNASEHDIKVGIAAAIAHDQATPALGDATKKLDQKSLSEEDFWYEVVDEKGWEYLEKIGTTKEEMDDIIHNKGTLGKVLDIVDRISYVMVDLGNLIHIDNLHDEIENAIELGYRSEIAEILRKDTNVGSIYKDIGINWENGEIYFRNPERLSKFLELRALLTKNLYMNPISQARDFMVVQAIKPYYSTDETDANKLTPNKLRRINDDELIQFIEQQDPKFGEKIYTTIGQRHSIYNSFTRWYPQYRYKFDTKEEMENRKRRLEAHAGAVINGVIESKGFNPALDYKVLTDDGEIAAFKDYDPHCTGRIERIAESTRGHILFWQKKNRRLYPEYWIKPINDDPPSF